MLDDAVTGWCQELEAEVLALLKDRVGSLGDDLGLDQDEALGLLLAMPLDGCLKECLKEMVQR